MVLLAAYIIIRKCMRSTKRDRGASEGRKEVGRRASERRVCVKERERERERDLPLLNLFVSLLGPWPIS